MVDDGLGTRESLQHGFRHRPRRRCRLDASHRRDLDRAGQSLPAKLARRRSIPRDSARLRKSIEGPATEPLQKCKTKCLGALGKRIPTHKENLLQGFVTTLQATRAAVCSEHAFDRSRCVWRLRSRSTAS